MIPVKRSENQVRTEDMKVENEFLIDGVKSAMMTMRRRPLADCSRLELRQPERHSCNSRQFDGRRDYRRLVLSDRKARRPGRSATATTGPRYRGALS